MATHKSNLDKEIVQSIPEKKVHEGSNITLLSERMIADHSEGEENIVEKEEVEPRPGSSSKPKNEIIWKKHLQLESPQFIWSTPPTSQIDSPHASIDYFF
ncbi:hypothetical protein HHI36_006098 [Cryptolaemus montrouzieri]|uniref:Uncharacterized protein n=1 Tax=Cryptolaemus montrouzieri TaxID=559131 RepID=A0ABD2NW99_9CUCU